MAPPAVIVEHVSKTFAVPHAPRANRLTEALSSAVRSWTTPRAPHRDETFHALDDISFEVSAGDVLGIIGRNGAGKSTLLKILAGVTRPSAGRYGIRGRVGCLLEVGTGFHPELTGRENIFLNGAILGLKPRDIRRRFDEIVAFSEVEAFLDTPLKHYSNGMQLRLAFAVAAHLDAEILIADEVLAVGDVGFQRKCLGKMEEAARSGRTILFVSHDAGAVSSLCTRAVLLDRGRLVYHGGVAETLHRYQEQFGGERGATFCGRLGDATLALTRAWVTQPDGVDGVFDSGRATEIGAEVEILQPVDGLVLALHLSSPRHGQLAFSFYDDQAEGVATTVGPCRITQRWVIPPHTLATGEYRAAFELAVAYRRVIHYDAGRGELAFRVENLSGIGRRYPLTDTPNYSGLFRPNWAVETRVDRL
jgi:lipopolysaccharide transport system ATP-binding protein